MNPLISGLFNQYRTDEELTSLHDEDAFELFCASMILPDQALTHVETTDLLLDPGVTGFDVILLEINGQVAWDITDVDEILLQSNSAEVAIFFIQAKRSTSIDSTDILGFGDSVVRFINNEDFSKYRQTSDLARAFRHIFDGHASKLKVLPSVNVYFACTASTSSTNDENVVIRLGSVKDQLDKLEFIGDVKVEALGADDLHHAWTKKNQANEVQLNFQKIINLPEMPGIDQAILGVVSVAQLLRLVEGDGGLLNESVFYDNVRGFKGPDNSVNKSILATLNSAERDLLPVLNNGITVVAEKYYPLPGDAIELSGYQIVNGCQTSHCLYLARDSLDSNLDAVFVPLRLVVTQDEEVATKIIKATNSQTEVEENDLVALSKFQKKLEDYYNIDDVNVRLRYERRSGQFYGKEVTKTRVVSIGDQMRAVSAVFLDLPHLAARYPKVLYKEAGSEIFRDDHKLLPYIASAFAAYRLETAFRGDLESSFKPMRYHILTAYKYCVLGEASMPLHSSKSESQAKKLIESLKTTDYVTQFRSIGNQLIEIAGGQIPSSDRIKRSPFTKDVISKLSSGI